MNALREVAAPHVFERAPDSIVEISITGGTLSMWGPAETLPEPGSKVTLRLDPNAPLIVGRQEGGPIPYMDPNYLSTQIGPDGQSVLTRCGQGRDRCVSRGHFMLRSSPHGVLFVNGVPKRGGGIRPPMNGTRLLAPEHRWFAAGEECLVERGQGIKICMPNGTEMTIVAG